MILDYKDSIKDNLIKDSAINESLVGSSNAITNIKTQINKSSSFLSRTLILGKKGTCKRKIARIIHDCSRYAKFPFHIFDCSLNNEDADQVENQLFGYETDNVIVPGLIEECSPGTILLYEFSELPIRVQKMLAMTLQTQIIKQGQDNIKIDTRFLASSSKDIDQELKTGRLYKNLYERICITQIAVPSLSERVSDIPEICAFLIKSISYSLGIVPPIVSSDALMMMQSYSWPENVEELKSVITSIIRRRMVSVIKAEDLPEYIISSVQTCLGFCPKIMQMSLKDARKEFEKGYISTQLKRFCNSITKTAEFIGMERSALYRKIKELNLDI